MQDHRWYTNLTDDKHLLGNRKEGLSMKGDALLVVLPHNLMFTLLPSECDVQWVRPSYQCLSELGQWLVFHIEPQWPTEKTNGHVCMFLNLILICWLPNHPFPFPTYHDATFSSEKTTFLWSCMLSWGQFLLSRSYRIHYAYSVMVGCFKTLWMSLSV